MSDDQGDAEFEAGLAGLGDGPQNGAGGAAAGGTDRALGEVRRTVEDLATRVGADVGEDLAQIRGALDRIEARLGTERGTLVEQLQDSLADVASGEVVGALWEEVRAVQAEIEGIAAALAARTEPTADPAVAGMRDDLQALADDVRALAGSADEPTAAGSAEDRLGPLTEELATLRAELTEGLVVEPSDALSASLDALRSEVDGLRDTLGELRDAAAGAGAAPDDGPTAPDELAAIRTAIDDVRSRLDEGLVLADDAAPTAPGERSIDEVADQLAALRDFVASELDGLQQAMGATRAAVEHQPAPAAPAPAIDDEAVEVLRDEIRAAGGVSDQLVEALRDELKALRRRIAVKASEKVLDDQQLAQIADAVAARLAEE